MTHSLTFFPNSFPDESLLSRISRYHLLSGNKTISSTYEDLFGKSPFPLEQIVPTNIEVLAERLPGSQREVLKALLLENTLLPLFLPYLGPVKSEQSEEDSSEVVSHIPRRVVGMHGEARLCLECVEDDKREFGTPYLHRSHQIPGVSACWKHRKILLSSCPVCACPFLFSRKLLSIPWQSCRCNWKTDIENNANAQDALEHAYEYALFTNKLLNKNLPPLSPECLLSIYKTQAIQLGFKRGTSVAIESLQEAIVEYFGASFIKTIDSAFSIERHKNWLRLTSYHSSLDMPITRHILLIIFLFKDIDSFFLKVELSCRIDESSSNLTELNMKYHSNEKNVAAELSLKELHREKILKLKKKYPLSSSQILWKQAFKSMSWLYDNDQSWLQKNILQACAEPALKMNEQLDNKDLLLAGKIESYAKGYFDKDFGKPARLTIGRLFDEIKNKVPRNDRDKFPLTSAKIELHTESLWHFRARRILWAVKELKKSGELISTSNIALVSGVSFHWVNDIINLAGWKCEALSNTAIDPRIFLLKSGIPPNWLGPKAPDIQKAGGRRHTSQAQIEPKSYLDLILMRG